MADAIDVLELAISQVEDARRRVARGQTKQVRQAEAIDYLKSIAYTWFRSHRPSLQSATDATTIAAIDAPLQIVLDSTERASARTTYATALTSAKAALIAARSALLTASKQAEPVADTPPDFSPLAADAGMRDILSRRWLECQKCMKVEAHLAATVMMGGLLEALFVAKANRLSDKGPLYRAKAAPKDKKTQQQLPLSEWTLRPYIDVGQELGWISASGRDIAAVLRDYRNYIHPEKERSHGISLSSHDSQMFWQITKSLAAQLLG